MKGTESCWIRGGGKAYGRVIEGVNLIEVQGIHGWNTMAKPFEQWIHALKREEQVLLRVSPRGRGNGESEGGGIWSMYFICFMKTEQWNLLKLF
jgi:hypothetical protein